MLKPAGSEVSSRARGDMHKEDKSLSLSMPVVTEEDEENESFSETGTDEILSNSLYSIKV